MEKHVIVAGSGLCRSANAVAVLFVVLACVFATSGAAEYYGTEIGDLQTLAHEVRGKVYVVDDETFFIRNFHYDGQGPGKPLKKQNRTVLFFKILLVFVSFSTVDGRITEHQNGVPAILKS